MTRLRWEIGDRLSPLHAARCWAAGAAGIDPVVVQKIAAPLSLLTQRLAAAEIDLAVFWRRLVAEAAGGSDDLQASRHALAAAGIGELALDSTASATSSLLAETRFAFQERYPKLAEQLSLRGRPLREQWEAYGAGLLRRIATLTHESFIPKIATVLLVSPYRGGDGDCDPAVPKVWIEAVLTNPIATVPEVLRLTWLVARLGLAAQIMPATTAADGERDDQLVRSFDVLSLALLPITLDAAAHLEIGGSPSQSPELIATAAEAWNGSLDSSVVDAVVHWWSQSQELNHPFPVALKALDRMLPGEPSLQLGKSW
jgi:hypothetical protein